MAFIDYGCYVWKNGELLLPRDQYDKAKEYINSLKQKGYSVDNKTHKKIYSQYFGTRCLWKNPWVKWEKDKKNIVIIMCFDIFKINMCSVKIVLKFFDNSHIVI